MQKILKLFFLLCMHQFFGQFSISGTITNKENKPLKNIHIHIGHQATESNELGYYSIQGIKAGSYTIDFSSLGYFEKDVKVQIDKDIILNVTLEEDVKSIEEINVSGNIYANKKSVSLKENIISKDKIDRYSNNSLGEALKEITGVTTLRTGNNISKPVIGGLHSNRVIILNQNVRVEDQQWGAEHAPSIDVNSAGKITVIKGSSALQFGGDAIGGFVLIDPLKIQKDTVFGKTMLALQTNGMGGTINSSFFKHKLTGFGYGVEGSLKYFGDRKSANYYLTNSGSREQNFALSVNHQSEHNKLKLYYSLYNAKNGILKSAHIGNINDLFSAIVNQQPYVVEDFSYAIDNPKQKIQHHLLKVSDEFNWNDYNFNVQYAFQNNFREEFDVRRGNRKDIPALDMDLKTHSFSVDVQRLYSKTEFKSGINYQFQDNFSNPETGIRPLVPTFQKNNFGAYGVFIYSLNEQTIFDVGLRYDFSQISATKYYLKSRWQERGYGIKYSQFFIQEINGQILTKPKFNYHNFSANAGVKKVFHHGYKGLLNLNLASRNPNVNELFSDGLHQSNGQIELGDLSFNREQAIKLSVSALKDSGIFNFEISPYINHINGFIYLQPTGFENTIRGSFPTWDYKQTNAQLSGIDINGSYDFTEQISYQLSMAYVNGWDRNNKNYLIDIPPFKLVNIVKMTSAKKQKTNYLVELKSEYVSAQNNYPNFDFKTEIVQDYQLVTVEVPISKPPKAYHLIGVYGETSFNMFHTKTTIGLTIDNLFNVAYRDYLNRQRFFADDLGRNIMLQIKFNY